MRHAANAYQTSTMTSVVDHKFAVTCVRLSGFVALFTSIVAGVSLFVFMGNEHLTDNFLAFSICMLLICPVCSLSAFCALQKHSNKAAVLFVVSTVCAFAALLGVMIAYLVEPDDQNSLAGLFPRNIFLIVGQYTIVLLLVALSFYSGLRVAMLIRTRRIVAVMKGEDAPLASVPVENETDNVYDSTGGGGGMRGAGDGDDTFEIRDPGNDGLRGD